MDTSDTPLERNDLWRVDRTSTGWGIPHRIAAVNTVEWTEGYAAITSGSTLYFLSDRPRSGQEGGKGDSIDKYRSSSINGVKSVPGLVTPISTVVGEGDQWVSPDGSYIIFTRFNAEAGWETTCDLFICFSCSSGWSQAVPLAMLNTDGPDFAVAISPDEAWLYYRANYAFVKRAWGPILEVIRKANPVESSH